MPFRIDAFTVPEAARPEFERRSRQTHALLRQQAGFVRDHWFEKVSGDGTIDVITMVEWRDEASIASAIPVVRAMHAATGFDPAAFCRENGIVANLGVYAGRDFVTPR